MAPQGSAKHRPFLSGRWQNVMPYNGTALGLRSGRFLSAKRPVASGLPYAYAWVMVMLYGVGVVPAVTWT
jgi:hypothetical protein